MDPKQHKPAKLRERSATDLSTGLISLRKELSSLKVSKVSSGVASKLAKIKVSIFAFSFYGLALWHSARKEGRFALDRWQDAKFLVSLKK